MIYLQPVLEFLHQDLSGSNSHAECRNTVASGSNSHAEGNQTASSGDISHAEGSGTIASGNYSHSGGLGTIADQEVMTAIGKYNTENNINTLFVVGNGTKNIKKDAFIVKDINGSGEVYVLLMMV